MSFLSLAALSTAASRMRENLVITLSVKSCDDVALSIDKKIILSDDIKGNCE